MNVLIALATEIFRSIYKPRSRPADCNVAKRHRIMGVTVSPQALSAKSKRLSISIINGELLQRNCVSSTSSLSGIQDSESKGWV